MRYTVFLVCCLLTACNVAKEDDQAAGKTLKAWNGQDIHIALQALGKPDGFISKTKIKIFVWNGTREVANTPFLTTTDNSDASHTLFTPTHNHVNTAPCQLKIATDKNDVIIGTSLKGTDLGCQPFAQKINATVQPQ